MKLGTLALLAAGCLMAAPAQAGAPLSPRFNADPSPHYFKDRFYLYATDDASNSGTYWDSTSWRLYTSKDLRSWTDDGAFLDVTVFKWARPDAKAWAPEAAYRNGKYYFYAPVGGDKIGVAVASKPQGPYRDARTDALIDKARDANAGAEPIDPQVLIDDDGQAYMLFGTRVPKIVKLNKDMVTTAGPIEDIKVNGFPASDPKKAYGEAPFLHKRNGLYYFSFSTGWPGQIVYATSKSPMGPYDYKGVILDYLAISTNHQAIIDRSGQSYLFYHDNLLPGGGSHRRSIAIEPLRYNADGTIVEVHPDKAQTWVRSAYSASRNIDPAKAASVTDATIRQTLRLTLGGDALRVRVSNTFGTAPLRVATASVRLNGGGFKPLTFSGAPDVSVPAGAVVLSDPVTGDIPAMGRAEVSLYLPGTAQLATFHRDLKNPMMTAVGDQTRADVMPAGQSSNYPALAMSADVLAPGQARTIVAFGDSITDADCAIATQLCRWSDVLAQRLSTAGKPYAVANAGISGNRILVDGTGPNAIARFERDVLAQPNVSHVIVLIGINDIGSSGPGRNGAPDTPLVAARDLIAGYSQMIAAARSHGIKVYGAEVLPFMGAGYSSVEKDAIRREVNAWVRTPGTFDGLVDFAKAVADPADPTKLNDALEIGDNLHPSAEGQRRMGEAIDLNLF